MVSSSPASHPRISSEERDYIETSIASESGYKSKNVRLKLLETTNFAGAQICTLPHISPYMSKVCIQVPVYLDNHLTTG